MGESQPASIADKEQTHRQQRRRWMLLMCLVLLHIIYFGFPLIPFVQVWDFLPLLALLPPVFALSYVLLVFAALRRRWQQKQSKNAFVPIPTLEDPL